MYQRQCKASTFSVKNILLCRFTFVPPLNVCIIQQAGSGIRWTFHLHVLINGSIVHGYVKLQESVLLQGGKLAQDSFVFPQTDLSVSDLPCHLITWALARHLLTSEYMFNEYNPSMKDEVVCYWAILDVLCCTVSSLWGNNPAWYLLWWRFLLNWYLFRMF